MSNNYYPYTQQQYQQQQQQNTGFQNYNRAIPNNYNNQIQKNIDDFSLNSEQIKEYDSFDDETDEQDNKLNKNNTQKKSIRKVFQIVKDKDKKAKKQQVAPYPNPVQQQPQPQQQPQQQAQQMQQMQPVDQYGVVPRIGAKTKTIIIQDEQGKELSRIVSSTRERPNLPAEQQQQQTGYTMQPSALNSLVFPQPQLQSYMLQPSPMVMPQPQYFVDPGYYPQGMYAPPPIQQKRTSISNDIIHEEGYVKPSSYRKSSSRKVADSSQLYDRRESRTAALKRKEENYIFCCNFCDKPTTDTCEGCWKICACPTWWALLIALFCVLAILGLIAVVVLMKLKYIT